MTTPEDVAVPPIPTIEGCPTCDNWHRQDRWNDYAEADCPDPWHNEPNTKGPKD
jgi:hypothetical protein